MTITGQYTHLKILKNDYTSKLRYCTLSLSLMSLYKCVTFLFFYCFRVVFFLNKPSNCKDLQIKKKVYMAKYGTFK